MCNKNTIFFFSCRDALKRPLFVVCFAAGYGGGNVCNEICSIPLYIPDLFQYSYEKKVIQRHGQKNKNEITSCGPQFDF